MRKENALFSWKHVIKWLTVNKCLKYIKIPLISLFFSLYYRENRRSVLYLYIKTFNIPTALFSRLSENKTTCGCVLFTTNFFVDNRLKRVVSSQVNWFAPNSTQASIWNLHEKTTPQTDYYFSATSGYVQSSIGGTCYITANFICWEVHFI